MEGGREGGRSDCYSNRYVIQWHVITFDVTWTPGVSESLTNKLPELVYKLVLSIPV